MKKIVLGLIMLAVLYYAVNKIISLNQGRYQYREQPVIAHLQNNSPTILRKYVVIDSHPDYKSVIYHPRQFSADGPYHGWDMLTAFTPMRLYLNRPATIAIAWPENVTVPEWLSAWSRDTQIVNNGIRYVLYRKSSGTDVTIGGNTAYLILLAEQDGTPSVPPKTPPNHTVPVPNRTCPDWVHDEYKAVGPDGKLYPTWHPQIDPVYWCYFNHEHGIDPSLFNKHFRVPFGYAGSKMGMHEAHVGFKSYVWDDNYGHIWLALQHQGTSTNQAACGQHHELDIIAKDKRSGEIVSEQYFVGDYGISRTLHSTEPLKPSACPDQGKIEPGNVGARFLPVQGLGSATEEPWTVNSSNVIGFNFADFTVNTYDPARVCADITCDSVIYTGAFGTNHALGYVAGFGPKSDVGHQGLYYTDPMGKIIRSTNAPDAVRQYIKPGVSINSNIPYTSQEEASCRDTEGTGGIMKCGIGLTSISSARENSIKIPN